MVTVSLLLPRLTLPVIEPPWMETTSLPLFVNRSPKMSVSISVTCSEAPLVLLAPRLTPPEIVALVARRMDLPPPARIPPRPPETCAPLSRVNVCVKLSRPDLSKKMPYPADPPETDPLTVMSECPRLSRSTCIPCFPPRTSAAAICTREPPLLWRSHVWMPALLAPLPTTVPDARTVTLPRCLRDVAEMPWPARPVTLPSVEMVTSPPLASAVKPVALPLMKPRVPNLEKAMWLLLPLV